MIFPLPKIEVIGAEAVRGPTGSKENARQLI